MLMVVLQVQKLQRAALKDPVKCAVSTKYSTVDKLQQYYIFIPSKYKVLLGLLSVCLSACQDCFLVSILNQLSVCLFGRTVTWCPS